MDWSQVKTSFASTPSEILRVRSLLIEQIKAFRALLRRYRKGRWQITEFALFGSVPHNDFRSGSDVDVLEDV
jgi:predicted nucleotidyltransferase